MKENMYYKNSKRNEIGKEKKDTKWGAGQVAEGAEIWEK